jgi:bacteriorhodopsin
MDQTLLIPFYVGIGVLSSITLYHIVLSRSFVGSYRDKLYYYHSNLITTIPIVLYIFNILNKVFLSSTNPLSIFYIEWLFSSPLILVCMGRFVRFPLHMYIYVSLCDLCMILSGYVSYISENPVIVWSFYGVGCILFIFVMSLYFRYNTVIGTSNVSTRIFKVIYYSIVMSWGVYPITHILYKQQILTLQESVCIFVGMDVLSKGIFTNLVLCSREIYSQSTAPSFLCNITKKLFKVHPLQTVISDNSIEDVREARAMKNEVISHTTKPKPITVFAPMLESTTEEVPEEIYEHNEQNTP